MSLGTVTLMLITTTGFYPGPKYDTFEECEALSAEITQFTTFCHYKEPFDFPLPPAMGKPGHPGTPNYEDYGKQLDSFIREFRAEAERKDNDYDPIPEANL